VAALDLLALMADREPHVTPARRPTGGAGSCTSPSSPGTCYAGGRGGGARPAHAATRPALRAWGSPRPAPGGERSVDASLALLMGGLLPAPKRRRRRAPEQTPEPPPASEPREPAPPSS